MPESILDGNFNSIWLINASPKREIKRGNNFQTTEERCGTYERASDSTRYVPRAFPATSLSRTTKYELLLPFSPFTSEVLRDRKCYLMFQFIRLAGDNKLAYHINITINYHVWKLFVWNMKFKITRVRRFLGRRLFCNLLSISLPSYPHPTAI